MIKTLMKLIREVVTQGVIALPLKGISSRDFSEGNNAGRGSDLP
jgi:hypothetical protein